MGYRARLQQTSDDEWAWEVALYDANDGLIEKVREGVGHTRADAYAKARGAAQLHKRRLQWNAEVVDLEV